MTTLEVATKLGVSERNVKKYKGQFKFFRSYFYRHSMTPEELANQVKAKIPTAKITDTGDHWHAFVGGAAPGSAKDSYMWVTFKI